MRGKRLKVLMIIAAIALIGFSIWLVQHVRGRHKAAEREASYQTVLAEYTGELKPGTSREQVERHLQTDRRRFRQMCCVANSPPRAFLCPSARFRVRVGDTGIQRSPAPAGVDASSALEVPDEPVL